MAWAPLLLVLLSHCTGSLSQPVLTQPPSLSASPGASARLTCTLRSDISVGSYRIYWFQQKSGSPPSYLLNYHTDSDKHQGSGVPSRFSGSKDASANAGILHISGLQPEDEADYYCAIWHNSASHSDTGRWGSGTKTACYSCLVYVKIYPPYYYLNKLEFFSRFCFFFLPNTYTDSNQSKNSQNNC
uniref:Ig-like domain-containing protein n=1 Tax=Prolemur simus TaxID=1328070 RepID=A0A8C8ZWN4_PROSS